MTPLDRFDSLFRFYAETIAVVTKGKVTWAPRAVTLDWTLLKRQALAESNLDPDAESPMHAEGLSQFMAATWNEWLTNKWHGAPPPNRHITPFDPEDSICAQADVMAWLLSVFDGDVRKALASYNFGIGHVKILVEARGPQWEQGLPEETRGYLKKILA